MACHVPPVGVGMDRLFNSVAMARADIPAASISVSKGRSASARAIASWRRVIPASLRCVLLILMGCRQSGSSNGRGAAAFL